MADVAIDSSVQSNGELAKNGSTSFMLVDVSSNNIYAFYIDGDINSSFVYNKSTDGGQTWGGAVSIEQSAVMPSVWYDKWTSGDSGTKIHIAYSVVNDDTIYYRSLDTSSDTLSSRTTIESSNGQGALADPSGCTKICKSRGGNLYCYWSDWTGVAFIAGFRRSTDSGANWTDRSSPEEADQDGPFCHLLPANLADNQDMWMVYGDQSANEISLKTYDDSANSWSETSITTAVTLNSSDIRQTAASIRHSDGHIILAINSVVDNAAADLLIYDITDSGTITPKTNIITNADDWATVAIYIDQNSDKLYVGWLGKNDGSETWTSTVTIWNSTSTDGGANWSTPAKYSEDTADDFRSLWSSHSSPGAAAGRFGLMWFDDDDNDQFYGYTNSVPVGGSVSPSKSPSTSPSVSLSPSISPSTSPSVSVSPSKSPSVSPSVSLSPSISPSTSPSVSVSPSTSPSVSISPSTSPSVSVSPSTSPSVSLSPSISPSTSPSVSVSPSTSPSVSLSPSISPSTSPSVSISPSTSPSVSLSPSISPSISPSLSPSISPSISPSTSPSVSVSPSESPSISPSTSPSVSVSPSTSPSASVSISPSASPSESSSISPSMSPSLSPSTSPSAAVPRKSILGFRRARIFI